MTVPLRTKTTDPTRALTVIHKDLQATTRTERPTIGKYGWFGAACMTPPSTVNGASYPSLMTLIDCVRSDGQPAVDSDRPDP